MSFRDYEESRLQREERADRIAKAFHESYERQAPNHGYKTREESAVPWKDVPATNKDLMRAVVNDLIDRRVIVPWPAFDEAKKETAQIKSAWSVLNVLLR